MAATGTVRIDRTAGANKNLPTKKQMKNKPKGSFETMCDGTVHCVMWHDNSIVTIASNSLTEQPLSETKRRKKGGSIHVTVPASISGYNSGMGGVDLMDRLISAYRPKIRAKNGGFHCLLKYWEFL